MISSPTATPLVLSAVFVTSIAGSAATVVTVTVASSLTGSPLGGLPVAVTVFTILPASTSFCCTVYL